MVNGNQKSRSRCQLYSMLLKWICLKPFQQTELENMLVFPSYLSINLFIYLYVQTYMCIHIYDELIFILFTEINPIMFHLYKNPAPPKHKYTFFIILTYYTHKTVSELYHQYQQQEQSHQKIQFFFTLHSIQTVQSRLFIQKLLDNSFLCDYYQFDMQFD